MATTWTDRHHDHAIAHGDVGNVASLGLSAALPMAAYFTADIWGGAMGLVPVVTAPFGLPDWIMAAVMMLTLPMWGVARWLVRRHGAAGRVAGHWIVALILGTVLLPYGLSLANPFMAGLLPVLVLLTGIVAVMRSSALSGGAALLLTPGLVWFGLASLVGFTALAGGWSPPFALVDHNRH